ncbi:hypothetical protein AD929_08180 [Gluconobacter potus]|uniref:Uncharacterized protein n=1 Tax=Gluconobacter potus TaxID=2724927 RepID=A0A149QVD4_9PROT|nr:hypothetical protein AD929_08180 [Gluconobacter potus]
MPAYALQLFCWIRIFSVSFNVDFKEKFLGYLNGCYERASCLLVTFPSERSSGLERRTVCIAHKLAARPNRKNLVLC